ncbi:FAR1-related sequence 5-like protein [Tanacetum coccineum]
MVVVDDHDMIDIGEGSTPRDVIDISIPRDVFDVGEGSIPRDVQDVNIESIEDQEQTDLSDIESYRNDPDFAPTPNGTPYWRPDLPEDEKPMMSDIFDTFDDGYNMYKVYVEKGRFNIRPTLAHRLKVALMGGYEKVRGRPGDYRNFKRVVNLFIGDRDAQMIVDKMINRQLYVPEFSFEHHVLHEELVSMFWADDTMKCNYAIFGDVVSFDATFRTNKYDFVFVPFTGIDHNQKCVTFGAALLSDETEDSYCWMLKAFLKVHRKQPQLALTDQDAALRNVVVKMFPDSKHRLCMWHITQKLPGKISSHSEGNVETCVIRQTDKRSKTVIEATVIFNQLDGSLNCSCGHYTRHGYLCRHIFCVLRIHNFVRIPETYINRRWTKEALPAHLLEKRHIYGPCIEETDRLAAEVHATIEDCVGLLRNNTDKLTQFLTTVKEMKKQLEAEMQTSNYDNNKEALYANLLGVTVPEQVGIKNPKKYNNKGKCGRKGHNRRKCTGKNVMEEDEVQEVDGEDEVDEEDEIHDVDEDYESDEDNESGEDNSSDEDASAEVDSNDD